eukprot:5285498-Prorocentrum_lima.AAC.1
MPYSSVIAAVERSPSGPTDHVLSNSNSNCLLIQESKGTWITGRRATRFEGSIQPPNHSRDVWPEVAIAG